MSVQGGGPRYRVGVDIGGTFTDFVLHDTRNNTVLGFKVLTTPDDPSRAIFQGLDRLRERHGVAPDDIAVLAHATTLATNTIIEGTGARTALVTTSGFRDLLEMRRENRYDDRDLTPEFPPPLVPRRLRREVRERMMADGSVRVPLDEADARRVLAALGVDGIETLAVSFLHAPINAEHERRFGAIAAEMLPEVPISLSSAVQPEIREYERTNTTVANAYVQLQVRRYLKTLMQGLAERGYGMPVYIMQSNGGFAPPEETSAFPVRMIESGPAAGAIAAADVGRAAGEDALIGFDMGGTTAKIALLRDGEPRIVTELEVARIHRFKPGSGYPIMCPSVELSEIGAGGGSIAGIDALGLLRVGPRSAGAQPGPACYGQGGTEPTVTDADLVLGYIDADGFAGGTMRLDREAAERAIRQRVAEPAGIDLVRAAWGIHDIVNRNMATAARLHVLGCGADPRRFTLVAFGGAGPVHAHQVAAALGIRRVLYPYGAGVASARGLMVAPMARDLVRSCHRPLNGIDWRQFEALIVDMKSEAVAAMASDAGGALALNVVAEMRYAGQGYDIRVPVPAGALDASMGKALEAAFLAAYEQTFGRRVENVPIQLINLRLFARGPRVDIPARPVAAGVGGSAPKGRRPVYFGEAGAYVDCPVYDRHALRPGDTLEGPAVFEEPETTVIVGPRARATIDPGLNLIVERDAVATGAAA